MYVLPLSSRVVDFKSSRFYFLIVSVRYIKAHVTVVYHVIHATILLPVLSLLGLDRRKNNGRGCIDLHSVACLVLAVDI